MKKLIFTLLTAGLFTSAFAQESESKFAISTDLVSRYVWRGTQFSDAPAIQPGLSYSTGGFTAGAWGSYAFNSTGTEVDLYASYAFDFGLKLGVTDYFLPIDAVGPVDGDYFVTDSATTGHIIELAAAYTFGKATLSVNKFINNDKAFYTELSYAFNDNISAVVGAGDQVYSRSGNFNVVNVGVKYAKEVELTDKYSLTPFVSFTVNPNQEQVFLVVGVTL